MEVAEQVAPTRVSQFPGAVAPVSCSAIVLAGGALERDRFPELDRRIRRKVRIPILGRSMLAWTVAGIRAAPSIRQIVVVGDPDDDAADLDPFRARALPDCGDLVANLRCGIEALSGEERLLCAAGDLPLLHRECVEDFLSAFSGAEMVVPYADRPNVEARFGDREWVFARTADGDLTGCSAFRFDREALLRNWSHVEAILQARRKSPLGLALMVGPFLAIRLALGLLKVDEVERKLSSLLRVNGRAYLTPYPELAMDVHKESDLALVERELSGRPA
jgi:molybdopterin-guanine dinucleotide biosynthesis protein A